jgi:hypothetical protein
VFRSLRKINGDVFIILCSGYNHIICAGINKLLQSGAAGFFERPASSQDIGIAIKNAQHISATVDKQVCLIARRAGLSSSITMFSRPAALARYAVRPGISKILLFAAAYVFSKKHQGSHRADRAGGPCAKYLLISFQERHSTVRDYFKRFEGRPRCLLASFSFFVIFKFRCCSMVFKFLCLS